jgi:hypothetical protein
MKGDPRPFPDSSRPTGWRISYGSDSLTMGPVAWSIAHLTPDRDPEVGDVVNVNGIEYVIEGVSILDDEVTLELTEKDTLGVAIGGVG